ncbi:GNAT family N-acetyltransferase [Gilvimarinus xylanilyticus]|uniref:GNAT family N-acetyltransferase n=1 Tax=Gilvimarinus xylanilyticus TaxID=2944139 RepID=UPI003AF082D9
MAPYHKARGDTWNEENIRRYFLSMESVVLEDRGQVSAFTFYELSAKGAHIHTLQVAPERQNGMLGSRLFRWYLELGKCSDNFELTCNVYTTNPAFKLYLKLGFVEVERDGDVAHLRLPLTSNVRLSARKEFAHRTERHYSKLVNENRSWS